MIGRPLGKPQPDGHEARGSGHSSPLYLSMGTVELRPGQITAC